CWGLNADGQVGNNSTTDQAYAVAVSSTNLTAASDIACGNLHSCAVKTDGTVWCWGNSFRGQVGYNSTSDALTPKQVVGPGGSGFLTNVAQVVAGEHHTCARKNDGTVWCWGDDDYGQMGNTVVTTASDYLTPVQVLQAVGTPLTG